MRNPNKPRTLPMLMLKTGFFVALSLVIGCDKQKEHDRARAERTIVLECSGDYIDTSSSKRDPVTYLIKIDPFNPFQTSLHFFSSKDKMFMSPCEERLGECRVSADSNLIVEYGVMRGKDNQVLLGKTTEINRRTGSMRIVSSSVLGDETIFDGSCKKSAMPTEESQKF